ncbi:MAG: hypothetical protein B6241_08515 [Spirochaetaceae bacterium 4572_59]|nr:MAG: hypothetical protein B6241_08515 [Spirochaetaceae bacterium 4572_59]
MDKNTFLAILLSVVVISGGFFIQTTYFMPEEVNTPFIEKESIVVEDSNSSVTNTSVSSNSLSVSDNQVFFDSNINESDYVSEIIKVETNKFYIEFNTDGAVITSMKLKDHMNGDNEVDMILNNETGLGSFGLAFGENYDSYLTDTFQFVADKKNNTYSFIRDYQIKESNGSISSPFRIEKKFVFFPDEYLFELRINITNSKNSSIPLNINNQAYTLSFGPQIGPDYKKLDGRNEYRKYYSLSGEKRTTHKPKNGYAETAEQIKWTAIVGKYFTVIGIPSSGTSKAVWSNSNIDGLKDASEMFYVRSSINSSRNEDVYQFYLGPKNNKNLTIYNNSMDNTIGFSNMYLDKVVDSSSWLGWLEFILKFVLEGVYKIIPNYGVAIILLTILIKIVLFPFTHKSYESTGKMQSIQPKVKEIQTKYKNDPNKMNKEMADLYKKEGVNPMGGCLPMLIQMPIFFALYGLLNKYFDLRGAVFIPGWINDLSASESIWNFGAFTLPILGWNDLRLLPILYLGTQLLMSKFTQAPSGGGQNAMQTKMLTLGMPIMFFFILYDMPSGLLLYWTVTNLLTAVQQGLISKKKKKQA